METELSPFVDIKVVNKSIATKHLRNSSVTLRNSSLKRTLNILRYTWCVGSYGELQTGVTYEHFVEKAFYSCTFQLEKTDKDLNLSVEICGSLVENCCVQVYMKILLQNNTSPDSDCFGTDNPLNSEIKRAGQDTKGNFTLKFPLQDLEARIAFQKAPLYVLYHCVTRSKEKTLLFWTGSIGKKSATEVSRGISFEKNSTHFSDFRIITRKRIFPAHKCILTVRSRYFFEYFTRHGHVMEMKVDALPGIVWYVLCYMYSGQMDVLDINSMILIYHLADKWKILSLMDNCSNYLRGNMDLKDMNKAKELELDLEGFGMSEVTKRLQNLKLCDEAE